MRRTRTGSRIAGRRRLRPVAVIPASSIADIAFLLVVFFALVAHEPDRTRVTLPESQARIGSEQDAALVVVAYERDETGAGQLVYKFSDGRQQSHRVPDVEAIGAEAARLLTTDPTRQFRIKADGETPCREIGKMLDALTASGAGQIMMLTTESREEAP